MIYLEKDAMNGLSRAFLASDGNIVWYFYNKTWVMDVNNNYRV